jgi:transcriptional regulator with XRE-family HTH domain
MDIKKAFGKTLRMFRRQKKFSQEFLGLESDMNQSDISDLERGLREPSLSTVFRLCKTLGIKPSELIRKVQRLTRL